MPVQLSTGQREENDVSTMNLPWLFLGRPIKPVAFGLLGMMVTTASIGFVDRESVLGDSAWSLIVAAAAALVAVAMVLAWYLRSQELVQWCFLGCFAVWLARVMIYVFDTHPGLDRTINALMVTVVAGGSYFLEVSDDGDPFDVSRLRRLHVSVDHAGED